MYKVSITCEQCSDEMSASGADLNRLYLALQDAHFLEGGGKDCPSLQGAMVVKDKDTDRQVGSIRVLKSRDSYERARGVTT